jgi:hypothetical protein
VGDIALSGALPQLTRCQDLARNGRANRAVECLMLGVDRETCALREHFAF